MNERAAANQEATGPERAATRPSDSGPPVRRLTRRTDEGVIAGVAAGLGHYTGLDPVIFRLTFIVLAVFGMTGVLLYLLAWAVVPRADGHQPADQGQRRRARPRATWLGIALVVLAGLALIWPFVQYGATFWPGPGFRPGPIFWAIVFLAIGAVLLRDEAGAEEAVGATTHVPAERGAALAAQPRRGRVRSPLGWFTIAAILLLTGAALLASNAGIVELYARHYIALALLALGAGLIVGAWWGRARLLIPLGVALLPLLLVSTMVDVPLRGAVGGAYFAPRTASDIGDGYELLLGDMTVDLTDLRSSAEPIDVSIRMVMGRVEVHVPPKRDVDVSVAAEAGDVFVFGKYREGLDIAMTDTVTAGDGGGDISIDIDAGMGSVSVHRIDDPRGQHVHDRKTRGDLRRDRQDDQRPHRRATRETT